jgi:hypothetical protein
VLAHEALARGADERHRLGEQHAHRVAEGERLRVGAAFDVDLLERRCGQLDGRVERQRGELLALRLLHRLRLLFGELAQAAQEIFGIAAERKTAAFHVGQATNVKVAAVLAALLLLAGCGSQSSDDAARGALSPDELAWIRSYVGWRVDFDRETLSGGRALALRSLGGCAGSLRDAVGSAPTTRLRPVARLAQGSCADWRRYTQLFRRFYERNDFAAGPRMSAAESDADEASTRALDRLQRLLWESRRLQVVDAASHDSRIQPRYARAANTLTSRTIEIRCWNADDWERVQREAAAFEDLTSVDVDGYASFGTGRVNLGPNVCDALDDLAYRDKRSDKPDELDRLAYGVFVLAHESDHVAGVDDEAVATCDGLQNVQRVARLLGADAVYARRLALAYWNDLYVQEPEEYRTLSCGPERPLDRSPGDGVWP